MALTPSLLESIERDFPHLSFVEDEDFQWSPHLQTISYDASQDAADSLLLHELGHAQLQHAEYHRDVQLIAMETDAWEAARGRRKVRFVVPLQGVAAKTYTCSATFQGYDRGEITAGGKMEATLTIKLSGTVTKAAAV